MKFFARFRSRKKKGWSRLFRYGWKVTLLLLLAGAGFAVFLFYGTWAQTFDLKNVGEMPERNTVYDVDGKIYSRLAGANRLRVSLSEVSPFFIAAVLASPSGAALSAGNCSKRWWRCGSNVSLPNSRSLSFM
jgi:membrane peptidoglycan carboxypeptidase